MTTQPAYPGLKETCPHPDCEGVIKIAWALPAGVYDCPCKTCSIRVSWTTYADYTRKVSLSLEAPKATD